MRTPPGGAAVAAAAVDVFFVDYGNAASTEVSEVKQLPEALTAQPPFAIRCVARVTRRLVVRYF